MLPWRQKKRREQFKKFYSMVILCSLSSFLILWSINNSVYRLVVHRMKGHKLIQKEINYLDKKINSMKLLKQSRQVLISKLFFIQDARSDRVLLLHVLNEISKLIPSGIYMNRLERKNKLVTLWGHSVDSRSISILMHHLEHNHWLQPPSLIEIKKIGKEKDSEQHRFQLVMTLRSRVYS